MNMLAELSEPFPVEVERQLRKGSAMLTYIPVSEVITRLNKVLGVDMWSYEVMKVERDSLDPEFVVAHVRLTATFIPTNEAPNLVVVREGIGGQKIKRTKSGDIVDLGDEFKGAVSDALKKAAQSLGVGLYLARSEEALYLEEVEDVESAISEEHFEKLRTVLNSLSTAEMHQAREHWDSISNDLPFERLNITRALLDQMLDFVRSVRLPTETGVVFDAE